MGKTDSIYIKKKKKKKGNNASLPLGLACYAWGHLVQKKKENYTLPLPSPLYCLGRPRVGCQRKLEESKDSFRESEREMKELSNEDQTDRQTMLIF